MKLTRKKIILGIFAIVVILAVALIAFSPKPSPYEFSIVTRKDIKQIVSASGTVKPAKELNLQFETSGKIKNIFVKVGDEVKMGKILIKLDDSDLQTQYQQQKAAVDAAEAQLALLKAGSSPEEIQLAQNTVTNAEKNLADVKNKANNDLNNLYKDATEVLNDAYLKNDAMLNKQISDLFNSNDTINFTTTHTQAQNNAENYHFLIESNLSEMSGYLNEIKISYTQDKIDDLLSLFKTKLEASRYFLDQLAEALINSVGISSTNLTTYKTNLDTARTNINTAISAILTQQQSIASQKITNQININTAQTTLDQANDQLAIKKAGPRQEDINYQEALVNQQKASLTGITEKIRKTSLIAPIDGIIIAVNNEIGETVLTTSTPISMNSLGNFEIELDISETDIPDIAVGQVTNITLDAFPDENFLGHVASINPAQTVIDGVVYYQATITFDNNDPRIKAGMSSNVDITTAQKNNVLTVPMRAVTRNDGTATVKILKDNKVVDVEVKIGISSEEGDIEIISGLSEGQQIISFIKTP